jgi:serine/threonine protein kinase
MRIAPPLPDKAWLREHYPRVPVDSPAFRRGDKGRHTLGRGRHGAVKLARSVETDRLVAVKSEPKSLRTSAEWTIHRALRCPHVVEVLAVAEGPRKRYIVMELGETTLDKVMAGSAFTFEQARLLFRDLLLGLDELHAMRVYHRDIKAGNLVLIRQAGDGGGDRDARPVAKIIDLGKAVYNPTRAMRQVYARRDAEDACLLFDAMLRRCGHPDRAAFAHWYKSTQHLRISTVERHPLVADLFPTVAPGSPPDRLQRFCTRIAWHMHRSVELATAKLPLRLKQLSVQSGR